MQLEEEQSRTQEAMQLLGQQQQVVAEHWDISSRSLIKACAQMKKENSTLQRELQA